MKTQLFTQLRQVPAHTTDNHVVSWHVFRTLSEAEAYADHIVLNPGQHLAGGIDHDSVGSLWWVGVEVDDLSRWGNAAAVNKHAE
ncbi:hypothetical protein CAP31_12765 [Sulfuriferula sp. AH1]|uniref:hypothetical protein n=1 Tax=Sulfuriferula sp. AH1 TaxID=1985873 RepID=UPI000B3B4BD3|nr:hypothetical protein [Sulfuriferula sp. AH1]ARU32475.1 hypothetical protein CAP31_12765 [Sulfuriferula sp. AH1]